MKKVLIVGGGFAGIKCALDLSRHNDKDLDITLISDKSHFEYHAYLYRVVTGRKASEVCIPLSEIFNKTKVKVVIDTIVGVDTKSTTASGVNGIKYGYDFIVLALGSQTDYFGIEGLKEFSYGFKSIKEALNLKKHIHEMFTKCSLAGELENKQNCMVQIVVVGAGPSGVELAGELAQYSKVLAKKHNVDPKLVNIDLVEGASRVLPIMPENISNVAMQRLQKLGVKVMLNKKVIKEDIDSLYLNDSSILAKTIIWTAGTKVNEVYKSIDGLQLNKRGQVLVNEFMNPEGFNNVFVAGDAAQTKFSGLAPTALLDGTIIAKNILNKFNGKDLIKYQPIQPTYNMPIGQGWAIIGNTYILTGHLGWFVRRVKDFMFFRRILPLKASFRAFSLESSLCENCDICTT